MASTEICSVCHKDPGYFFCMGCKAYFCKKDEQDHRKHLENELEYHREGYNNFLNAFKELNSSTDFTKLVLKQIDEWEQTILIKVKKLTDTVRQRVNDIWTTKKDDTVRQTNDLGKKLLMMTETGNFLEDQLEYAKRTIDQLHGNLKSLTEASTIQLNTVNSDKILWDGLIYVEEKFDCVVKQTEVEQRANSIVKQVELKTKPSQVMQQVATNQARLDLTWEIYKSSIVG